jgi:hypothetical protein
MKRKPNFQHFPPTAQVSEEDCLLTSRDVARLLAVDPQTVKGWRSRNPRTGTGPSFIRIGGRVGRIRYSFQAVREYLRERTNCAAE